LRKSRKYDQALELYQEAWRDEQSSEVAAGVVNCLRAMGRLDEAEAFADEALAIDSSSNAAWLKTEKAWTLYVKFIKPVYIEDREQFLSAAREVMKLTNDFLPRKLTAFKVTDVLSKDVEPDWQTIRRWLEDIRGVETEPVKVDPGKKMSDKKKWFFKYTKALEKIGEYDRCRIYCEKAQRVFKKNFFFRHRAAKCSIAQKNYKRALVEYDALINAKDEWYLHYDLAEIYAELQDWHTAEQHIIIAVVKCKEMQLKIKAYLVWAQMLYRLQPANLWIPLYLFILFKQAQGWPVPREAEQLLNEYPVPSTEDDPDLPQMLRVADRFSRKRYRPYIPKKMGAVKNLREKFGFIAGDDGKDYFFSMTNVQGRLMLGTRVVFNSKQAYDRKKKRKSVEAIDIRLVGRA
ncbi:MAG: tetratricopeptide repeat protein, partial [Chitinivibrionales bacterium]